MDDLESVDRVERLKWRRRPVSFVTDRLGATPWLKQREILNALAEHDYVAVRSCNGSGKTYIAAHAVVWWLMSHEEAVVITTAPTERQVGKLLWREIRGIHRRNADLIGGRISTTQLELDDGSFAFGFSTDSAERFQGFHHENILFVADEASGVDEKIFEAIKGSMTSRNAKLLMIGNPALLSGTFYNAFNKDRSLWETIHISAFDVPGVRDGDASVGGLVNRDWVERCSREWGEGSAAYQVRVLGDFPLSLDDALIPLHQIENAVGRKFLESDLEKEEPVMGLDVARFGDNRSVACVRRGPSVLELLVLPNADIMETTGRALDVASRHSVGTIHVDEVGLGAGVVDRMKEIKGVRAIGVNGGKKSKKPEQYANLRAELYGDLRDRFREGTVSIPNDSELISELASLTYKFTSRGQMQLEDKQSMRSRGLGSPDKADALMLAFGDVNNKPLRMWVLHRDFLGDGNGKSGSRSSRRLRRRKLRPTEWYEI